MKLPVAVAATSSSPEGLWRRYADVAVDHALAAGEEIELPYGRGVCGDDAASRAAPGFAIFPTGDVAADALADVLAPFDARGGGRPRIVEPGEASLSKHLAGHRYRRRAGRLMRLKSAVLRDGAIEGLLLVPGRAAREAYETWCAERTVDDPSAGLLPRHLDDPQYESFVALVDGRAVGAVGLQIRGQIGLVADILVRPEERLRGIASVLLVRALEAAARSQLHDVFAAVTGDDEAPQRLLDRAGFATIRAFVEWLPPTNRG